MPKEQPANDCAPFQRVTATCRITGLSQSYLRAGCKRGDIPHIRSGATIYINVPKLLEKLNHDSAAV